MISGARAAAVSLALRWEATPTSIESIGTEVIATDLLCPTVSYHGRLLNGDDRSEERTQKQRIVSESIQAKQGSCTRLLASRAESRRVAASVAETVSEVVWVPGYVGL